MSRFCHAEEGKTILLLISILLLCGCVGQNVTQQPAQNVTHPPVQASTVTLTTEDGYRLVGTFYPAGGNTAVVLAHMGGLNRYTWVDFAMRSSEKGFPTFAFDFRCHGASECNASLHSLHLLDMRAAFQFLHDEGYKRIVCMGASLGGVACMNIAFEEELAGLVVIASSAPDGNFPEDLVSPSMPKLFIGTEDDRYTPAIESIPLLYKLSPEPKVVKVFPGTAHGTELFYSKYADEFRALLLAFLENLPTPGSARRTV